jgi:hypothetical protein
LIKPCNAIHMLFMSVEVDIAHVDPDGRVIRLLHGIKPWRLGPIVWMSAWVIELPAGTAKATGIQVGDVLELVAGGNPASLVSPGKCPRRIRLAWSIVRQGASRIRHLTDCPM